MFRLLIVPVLFVMGGMEVSAETIRLRTLALRSGEMPEVFVRGAKGYEPLRFSAVQPSAPVEARQAGGLPIYKRVANAAGESQFVMDQKVTLPVGKKGYLLLGWSAGGKAKFVAIADEFVGARFNDWLLVNTTKKTILFKAGNQTAPAKLAPGKSGRYKIREPGGQGAAVAAQADFDGTAKTFYSTYWPVRGDKRVMVLFFEDGKKIRVKRISDKLVPAKEAGEE